MYCPECGTLIDADAVFCPECGTRVADDDVAGGVTSAETGMAEEPAVQALILTHLSALADKLGTTPAAVHAIIDAFISARHAQGIAYTLIDGGNCNTGNDHRSLSANAPWTEWADLVRDIHHAAERGQMPDAEYLFIIGGDDIVPMPVIRHYLADDGQSTDTTIDTDVPYAYPCGARAAVQGLATCDIYNDSASYMLGRLPLPADADFNYLAGFLQRAAITPYINVQRAYSQCDPHWRKVTRTNVSVLRSRDMLNTGSGCLTDDTCYSGICLTPEVDAVNVSNYLATDTQLAFFNLHGTAAPASPGFMGQSVKDSSDWRVAVMPSHVQSLTQPNVIVTEACYGARFKGFDTRHSMLQSALSAQTLIYLGSSRIAYGAVDSMFAPDKEAKGAQADVLTSEFVSAMILGYPAGDALYMARYALLDNFEIGPYEATTLAEFNLYGDPTLQILVSESGKNAPTSGRAGAPARRRASERIRHQKGAERILAEKMDSDATGISVLQMVRGAVNRQLSSIQETVARELYEHWGIRPRRWTGAARLQFTSGATAVALHCEVDNDAALGRAQRDGLLTRLCIITAPQESGGRILAVYAPR